MKPVFAVLASFLNFSFACGQIIIEGKIKLSPSWSNKLYLLSVENFSPNSKLLDSILLSSDGNFQYRMKETDPRRILYKLLIPTAGRNQYTSVEGHADNTIFLVMNNKDSCFITADADSFYFSSKLSGSANLKDPNAVQQLKRPFCDLTIKMENAIKANPQKAQEIENEFGPKWTAVIDTLRDELKKFIEITESPGGKLLGLYNLNLAGFGELDSLYTSSVIGNNNLKDYYLTQEAINVIQSAENNRIGQKLPDAALVDGSGKTNTLYRISKRITIIDFWASFCGPCRKANRNELRTLYNRLQNTDTAFLAMSVDEEPEKWMNAMKEDNIIWPSFMERTSLRILNRTLGISMVPAYVVVGEDHTVIYSTSSTYKLLDYLSRIKK